ncbi:WD40 repeat domain-containing protein [Gimesia alba]|uniref:WD40 repeat domain-containing protein n=1 Tax=Gimesia alba TaxID=2527973 RepID=UPI0011A2EB7D|nr:WD40 repeat domain-containing protein [Gimesia alba]
MITGACLGVRKLEFPGDAKTLSISTIETAEQSQTTYLLLETHLERSKSDEGRQWGWTRCQLLGFQGPSLIPSCQLELEDFQIRLESPKDSLTWDPHTRQLYIFGEYHISCFDPVSKTILRTIVLKDFMNQKKSIDELFVIDQPFHGNTGLPGKNQPTSTILVTFDPSREENLQGREKSTLPQWALIDSLSGKLIKSGVVNTHLKPINKQLKNNKEELIHWLYDDRHYSIKAINLLKNQTLLRIPWIIDDFATRSRYQLTYDDWHLNRDDSRDINQKIAYSQSANRVCIIGGVLEEIFLYDSQTGKRVTPETGMVNDLSPISANKFSGSFDYHDASVFQLKARDQIRRTFNTEVPENSCVAISADAKRIVVGETSGKATVWNLSNHKKLFTLTGVSNELLCIAADTSQNRIVAGDSNGVFWRWNYPTPLKATPEKVQRLIAERNGKQTKSHFPEKRSKEKLTNSLCALSPDGLCSLCFQPIEEKMASPLFSQDGENLLPVPGIALVVKLQNEQKFGEVIATENAKKQTILTPAVHTKSVLIQIKNSTSGRFALFVFNTGQVTIVDSQTGILESIIQTGNREIVDVDFHPDQKTLLVASYRGAVKAWNTDTYLKTGSLQLYDARLNQISSCVAEQGFDLVIGTRDTGLIVKRGVFPKSAQQPERPAALNLPFGGPLPED